MPPTESFPAPSPRPDEEEIDVLYDIYRSPSQLRHEREVFRRTSERIAADPVLAEAALRRIGLLPPEEP